MNYGEAIEKAWKIIWRFKILWVFGLLASCAGGVGSVPTFNYQLSFSDLPFEFRAGQVPYQFYQFYDWLRAIPPWVWILLVLGIIVLALLGLVIGQFGRIGIMRGAWRADEGADRLTFGQLFSESMGYFWRFLGLNLLVGLPGFLFALLSLFVVFITIINAVGSQLGRGELALICLTLPLFCLLIPIGWILSVLGELSNTALIGEGLGVFASISRGWKLMWKKVGSVILISLLLFVVQIAAGILLGIPAALLVIPFVGGALVSRSLVVVGVGFAVLILVLILIGWFVSSIFHAYGGSLWVITFRRLTAAPEQPLVTQAPVPTPPAM